MGRGVPLPELDVISTGQIGVFGLHFYFEIRRSVDASFGEAATDVL